MPDPNDPDVLALVTNEIVKIAAQLAVLVDAMRTQDITPELSHAITRLHTAVDRLTDVAAEVGAP